MRRRLAVKAFTVFFIFCLGMPHCIHFPTALQSPGGYETEVDFAINFSKYHSYSEVVSILKDLQQYYPNITKLYPLGKTYENRTIYALKISDNPELEEQDEPEVYINGVHHGNERLSAEVPLYLAALLTSGYGVNSNITNLVDSRQVWIVPVVNPDGMVYGWRKNRVPNSDGSYGVDLNRNYDWNRPRAGSSDPKSPYYKGTAPFSELETQAIRDLVNKHNFTISVSYHGYVEGGIIYCSPDWDWLASGMTRRMSTPYKVKAGQTPCDFGAGQDVGWLCQKHGIIAFLVELPPEEILPVCKDNAEALLYLIEMAGSLRRRVPAPSPQGAINAVIGVIFLVLTTGALAVMLERRRKEALT